jgi:hypothetical protein
MLSWVDLQVSIIVISCFVVVRRLIYQLKIDLFWKTAMKLAINTPKMMTWVPKWKPPPQRWLLRQATPMVVYSPAD